MTFNQEQDYWAGYKGKRKGLDYSNMVRIWAICSRPPISPSYPAIGYRQWNFRHDGLASIGEQQDVRQQS